jgi:DNA polymerase-3 subunit delta'
VVQVLNDPKYREDRYSGIVLQLAQQMAELKENLVPLFGLLRIWLRDLLVSSADDGEIAQRQPGGAMTVFSKLQAIDRAEQELSRNCNRALVCEILLFRLQ